MFIFIYDLIEINYLVVTFTFHYVYIYIVRPNVVYATGAGFTFHYVYIYIWTKQRNNKYVKHLHSTMFIFIYWSSRWIYCKSVIYIPLCLYLYGLRRQEVISLTYLHSTMFIFI